MTHVLFLSPLQHRIAGPMLLGCEPCLRAENPHVVWCSIDTPITAVDLARWPALRFIVCPATGLDHIDMAAAEARGVTVLSLRDTWAAAKEIPATAELTVGLMLALLRRLPAAHALLPLGTVAREQLVGRNLAGMTVGLLGYGRVGHQVAARLHGFGCQVIWHDPAGDGPLARGMLFERLLATADILSIHAELNDTTRNRLDSPAMAQMKPGAYLVNTSRGQIVNERALLSALEREHLAGAALDVHADEPGSFSRDLRQFAARYPDRLILTPHLGGCTHEATSYACRLLANLLLERLNGTT